MNHIWPIAAVWLFVSSCFGQEPQIGLETESGHLLVRNYSGAAVTLKGAMLNDREDCYLFPAVSTSEGTVALMSPEALDVAVPRGNVTFSLEPYQLQVGDGVVLSFDQSPCVSGTSRAIRVKVVFDEGEFGSYVDFPVPFEFGRP